MGMGVRSGGSGEVVEAKACGDSVYIACTWWLERNGYCSP